MDPEPLFHVVYWWGEAAPNRESFTTLDQLLTFLGEAYQEARNSPVSKSCPYNVIVFKGSRCLISGTPPNVTIDGVTVAIQAPVVVDPVDSSDRTSLLG